MSTPQYDPALAVPSQLGNWTPSQTNEIWLHAGSKRYEAGALKALARAFVGGVLLSLGGIFSLLLGGGEVALSATYPGVGKVFSAMVFPFGLIMISLNGADLATSNMAIFAMTVIKGRTPWWSYPQAMAYSMIGNLAGSLVTAGAIGVGTGILSSDPYRSYVIHAAVLKCVTPTWSEILLRAVACNFLVCVAVWQGTMATDVVSKIVAIYFPVFTFVACGFDHVIANMLSIPLAMMLGGDIKVGYYIWKSMIPGFLGNCIGGLILVLPLVCEGLIPFRMIWYGH
ncbi:hypothetical protein RQP46_011379 [Phenoliferia psychrophenolica]